MDKKIILIVLCIPFLLILLSIMLIILDSDDWVTGAGLAFFILVGVFSAVIVLIVLFFLRSKQLQWWQALLISLGSVIIVIAITPYLISIVDTLNAPSPESFVPPPGTPGCKSC